MNIKTELSEGFMSLLMRTGVILDYTEDGFVLSPDIDDWVCLEDVLWYIMEDGRELE